MHFVLKLPATIKGYKFVSHFYCFVLFFAAFTCLHKRICTGVSEHIPIVLLVEIRPLIELTKASGSYSHSNKDISFP